MNENLNKAELESENTKPKFKSGDLVHIKGLHLNGRRVCGVINFASEDEVSVLLESNLFADDTGESRYRDVILNPDCLVYHDQKFQREETIKAGAIVFLKSEHYQNYRDRFTVTRLMNNPFECKYPELISCQNNKLYIDTIFEGALVLCDEKKFNHIFDYVPYPECGCDKAVDVSEMDKDEIEEVFISDVMKEKCVPEKED